MSPDVPTQPLKGFMLQIKACKWDFVDIKSVMEAEILFDPVYPSIQIITIEAKKIKLRTMKIYGRRELNVCRRLQMPSIVHGLMLKIEANNFFIKILEFGLDSNKFIFHLFVCSCTGDNHNHGFFFVFCF